MVKKYAINSTNPIKIGAQVNDFIHYGEVACTIVNSVELQAISLF